MTSNPPLEDLGEVREVRRLMQLLETMFSMMQARYFLERMKRTKFENTMDGIFEVDGNLLAFSVSYGRAFLSAGLGRTVLKAEAVYGDNQHALEMHAEIMNFRNKKYAHHDDSLLPTRPGFLVEEGGHLVLVPQLELGVPLDSYERYDPLMRRMDEYLHEYQETLLKRASDKIGREIRMPSGPPPRFASDDPDS
jgi:hypothetical protein